MRALTLAMTFWAILFAPITATAAQTPPLHVVASFSLLADMAREIGGDAVHVTSLVKEGEDPHTYQPRPGDVRALGGADLILVNGLRFEDWMGRVIRNSGTKAKLIVASAGIRPRLLTEEAVHKHSHKDKNDELSVDPHAWQNAQNARLYVRNIAAAFETARPDQTAAFKQRAKAYDQRLVALDQKWKKAFATLAPENRTIVTHHDAFGYLGEAYGLSFVAPLGLSSGEQPSAAAVAALIDRIRKEKIKALFLEEKMDPRLLQQIAKDSGAKLGGKLYTDTLSTPDGEAPSYLAMMDLNLNRLYEGLR